MRERRVARIGTVSGLALLTGGTAIAAVAGGAHSVFATIMLGMLAAGLGHALLTEIQRQARRATGRWARADTINTVLLSAWTAGALTVAIAPFRLRAVGLLLFLAYALSTAHFVVERRRAIAGTPTSDRRAGSADQHHAPSSTTELSKDATPSREPELPSTAGENSTPTPQDRTRGQQDQPSATTRPSSHPAH
ncbi:hypothetical protein Asp14428_46960 [Actinoplanes sp. NBRC 14428]|nr:hypothetical protein Asp14428_46960 [Actinoplanes sp. NBRC 14428]